MVNDLRRRRRDPISILLWAGIPFGILVLFSLAFGSGGEVKPQASLLVVDQDETMLSGLLSGVFNQGELADLVDLESVGLEEGKERIGEGKASALLIIPEGFGEKVLNEDPVTLRLLTNPSQSILPKIVQGVLEILVDGTFYAQRILGEPVREMMEATGNLDEAPSDKVVSDLSLAVNARVRNLQGKLFPPLIELVEEKAPETEEEEGLGFGGLFFQSMLFMFLLFAANGVSDELWREREEGTLRRILAAPGSLTGFLLGKVLAGVVFIGGILASALIAGTWMYDLPWAAYLPGLAWLVLIAGLLVALFGLVQLFAGSRRGANLLLNLIVFPMMMLGGSFFPPEVMPGWLAAIGRWTPNGYGLRVLKEIQAGTPDSAQVAVSFLGVALLTGMILWLNSIRLRRRFAAEAA